MSKYQKLWEYVQNYGVERNVDNLTLTFCNVERIAQVPIDHSFLQYKKELLSYGWQVGKISLKAQNVTFHKIA